MASGLALIIEPAPCQFDRSFVRFGPAVAEKELVGETQTREFGRKLRLWFNVVKI